MAKKNEAAEKVDVDLSLDLKEVYRELCPKCRQALLALASRQGAQKVLEKRMQSILENDMKK